MGGDGDAVVPTAEKDPQESRHGDWHIKLCAGEDYILKGILSFSVFDIFPKQTES